MFRVVKEDCWDDEFTFGPVWIGKNGNMRGYIYIASRMASGWYSLETNLRAPTGSQDIQFLEDRYREHLSRIRNRVGIRGIAHSIWNYIDREEDETDEPEVYHDRTSQWGMSEEESVKPEDIRHELAENAVIV